MTDYPIAEPTDMAPFVAAATDYAYRINQRDDLHAFAYYYGHINQLCVRVCRGDYVYMESGEVVYKFDEYLSGELYPGWGCLSGMLDDLRCLADEGMTVAQLLEAQEEAILDQADALHMRRLTADCQGKADCMDCAGCRA